VVQFNQGLRFLVGARDGSADAFLHSSVVSRAGMRDVAEGTKLLVTITGGAKGRGSEHRQELGMRRLCPRHRGVRRPRPEVEMTG